MRLGEALYESGGKLSHLSMGGDTTPGRAIIQSAGYG
jgi:hypothetical protein